MRWAYRSILIALATLLSFSQASAFESPSGYITKAVYTVDWSYTEPIVSVCATDLGVAQKVTDNLTILSSCKACYKSYTSGNYITYKLSEPVALIPAKPQRGYTKVLFS